jgi:hypothetical protein
LSASAGAKAGGKLGIHAYWGQLEVNESFDPTSFKSLFPYKDAFDIDYPQEEVPGQNSCPPLQVLQGAHDADKRSPRKP